MMNGIIDRTERPVVIPKPVPQSRRFRSCFRVIRVLQFQLAAAIVGLLFWIIPYGIDFTKDGFDQDKLHDAFLWEFYESFPTSNQTSLPYRGGRPRLFPISKSQQSLFRQKQKPKPKPIPRKRNRERFPRVLFFVHIHKGAGTTFCTFAHRNNMSISLWQNCNVQKDQRCCGGKDTIKTQMDYAQQTNYDLVAIEREMYETMAPNHYDYVVTLRHSKSRYYSHWRHLRGYMPIGPGVQTGGFGDSAWIFANNGIKDIKTTKRQIPPGIDPLGTFSEWSEGQPDNWNTRILCGPKCRPQAKFQITKDLFHFTLSRLEQFSHLLFVEEMEESYNQFAKHYRLRNYTDITTKPSSENNKNNNTNSSSSSVPPRIPTTNATVHQELWNPFMSSLDDALYEFAQRIFHNETLEDRWRTFSNQEEVNRYFMEGPQMGCTDACCGHCSAY